MSSLECFSCGGFFPDVDGPVHAYLKSTPGCWQVYGEVLAREYSDRAFFEIHRLTVDAYAVQHPGGEDRRSIQSVGVHLIRLCLFLEHGLTPERANDAMLKAARKKHTFHWLRPPENPGSITAADVYKVKSVTEHKEIVRRWASEVWGAWSDHHETIGKWIDM